jgi:tRNA(Leu) C34 or U34 (ribose-2'-O)-methylase TrmL
MPDKEEATGTPDETQKISPARLERLKTAAGNRIRGVRIGLQGITNEGNRSAILRSFEALGLLYVEEIGNGSTSCGGGGAGDKNGNLCPDSDLMDVDNVSCSDSMTRRKGDCRNRIPIESDSTGKHIVNGAEKWLIITIHSSPEAFAQSMKEQGVKRILGATVRTFENLPHYRLEHIDFDMDTNGGPGPICLVFGSEGLGLTDNFLQTPDCCTGTFSIPMLGLTESLNVSVSVAIAAHYAGVQVRQLRSSRGQKLLEVDEDVNEETSLFEEYKRRAIEEKSFVKKTKRKRQQN